MATMRRGKLVLQTIAAGHWLRADEIHPHQPTICTSDKDRILLVLRAFPELAKRPSMAGHPLEDFISEPKLPWRNKLISIPLFFFTMVRADLSVIEEVFDMNPEAIKEPLLCDEDIDGDAIDYGNHKAYGPTLLFLACLFGAPHAVIEFFVEKYPEAIDGPLILRNHRTIFVLPVHVAIMTNETIAEHRVFPVHKMDCCKMETVELLVERNPNGVSTPLATMRPDEECEIFELVLYYATDYNCFRDLSNKINKFIPYTRLEIGRILANIKAFKIKRELQLIKIMRKARSIDFSAPEWLYTDDESHIEAFRLFLRLLDKAFLRPCLVGLEEVSVCLPLFPPLSVTIVPEIVRKIMSSVTNAAINSLYLAGINDLSVDDQVLRSLALEVGNYQQPVPFELGLHHFSVSEESCHDLLLSSCLKAVHTENFQVESHAEGDVVSHVARDAVNMSTIRCLQLGTNGVEREGYTHYPKLFRDILPRMEHLQKLIITKFLVGRNGIGMEYFFKHILHNKSLRHFSVGAVANKLSLDKLAEALSVNNTLEEFQVSDFAVRTNKTLHCLTHPLRHADNPTRNTALRHVAFLRGDTLYLNTGSEGYIGDELMYLTAHNRYGIRVAEDPETSPNQIFERMLAVLPCPYSGNCDHITTSLLYAIFRSSPGNWVNRAICGPPGKKSPEKRRSHQGIDPSRTSPNMPPSKKRKSTPRRL